VPVTHSLAIVGSGPAAHTAAIYAARANLSPVVFEGFMAGGMAAGGQLMTTSEVENFPGFPEGISGADLCERFRAQCVRFGARTYPETVTKVDLSRRPFRYWTDRREGEATTLIVATGASARRDDIRGTRDGELWQRGVSACAVCDGGLPAYRDRPVVVLGGGDAAMEEALYLTRFASRVHVVHRRDRLRASATLQERARAHPRIQLWLGHRVVSVDGEEEVSAVRVVDGETGRERSVPAAGFFFAIGHVPNTSFLGGQLACDDEGYVLTGPGTTQTSVPGVFAAGDVQDKRFRQAVTAAASGCIAALEAERWIQTGLSSQAAGAW
jgi:thioredoxin reductase (NADPH)